MTTFVWGTAYNNRFCDIFGSQICFLTQTICLTGRSNTTLEIGDIHVLSAIGGGGYMDQRRLGVWSNVRWWELGGVKFPEKMLCNT